MVSYNLSDKVTFEPRDEIQSEPAMQTSLCKAFQEVETASAKALRSFILIDINKLTSVRAVPIHIHQQHLRMPTALPFSLALHLYISTLFSPKGLDR